MLSDHINSVVPQCPRRYQHGLSIIDSSNLVSPADVPLFPRKFFYWSGIFEIYPACIICPIAVDVCILRYLLPYFSCPCCLHLPNYQLHITANRDNPESPAFSGCLNIPLSLLLQELISAELCYF